MLAEIVVPKVDPIGLPAHPVLFIALLLLTQFLHLLFMNFVLGGSLIAAGLNVAAWRGNAIARDMARMIYRMLPVMISMAVTMGVAPLLFVQVLYGPYFYSANVRMGFAWFSFFVSAMTGFYLVYWLLYRGFADSKDAASSSPERPLARLIISVLSVACFLLVGWIMANNHELTLRPQLWQAPGHGSSRWYTPSTTTLPRYLHDVVGAGIVASLWLTGIGWWRRRRQSGTPELDTKLVHLGVRLAPLLIMVQIGLGILLLFRLDSTVRDSLLGFRSALGSAWVLSLAAVMAELALLFLASVKPEQFKWFAGAVLAAVVAIVGMLMGREHVRLAHLGSPESGSFNLSAWSIYPQYASLIVFALLLVAGLATVAVMLKWMLASPPARDVSIASKTRAREEVFTQTGACG